MNPSKPSDDGPVEFRTLKQGVGPADQVSTRSIPVVEETLDVQKRTVTTGIVRIDKTVEERTEAVDEPLFRDQVSVERRAVNRAVLASEPPGIRYEGDTMIVPVLEEVLVVEKRLMLKEELLIHREKTEFRAPQHVVLRREQVAIDRIPGERVATASLQSPGVPGHDRQSAKLTPQEEVTMNTALVGVFENREQADDARGELLAAGFAGSDVTVRASTTGTAGATTGTNLGTTGTSTTATGTTGTSGAGLRDEVGSYGAGAYDRDSGSSIGDWFRSLFGFGDDDDDVSVYSEAVRRGNYLVTVNAADDDLIDRATDIMERCGSIDIDERATQWQQDGWTRGTGGAGTTGSGLTSSGTTSADFETTRATATGPAATGAAATGAALTGATSHPTAAGRAEAGEVTKIPVLEEEMRVGKREVRRGGIRVYTRVIDKPVEETVHLREEHANVQRRPVDRPATEADLRAMKEGSVEVRETSEEAVVSKQARVVEEVEVNKTVTDRDQTVRDTVRRTDVEVEKTDGDRTVPGADTGIPKDSVPRK